MAGSNHVPFIFIVLGSNGDDVALQIAQIQLGGKTATLFVENNSFICTSVCFGVLFCNLMFCFHFSSKFPAGPHDIANITDAINSWTCADTAKFAMLPNFPDELLPARCPKDVLGQPVIFIREIMKQLELAISRYHSLQATTRSRCNIYLEGPTGFGKSVVCLHLVMLSLKLDWVVIYLVVP